MPALPRRGGAHGRSTRRYHSVREAGALGRTAELGRPNGPRGACGAIEQGDAADEAQGGTRTSIQGAALCPRRADGRGHRFAADRQCSADSGGSDVTEDRQTLSVFLDLLPNQPKNDQTRENFRGLLRQRFEN